MHVRITASMKSSADPDYFKRIAYGFTHPEPGVLSYLPTSIPAAFSALPFSLIRLADQRKSANL
jgi:hypothetical protein